MWGSTTTEKLTELDPAAYPVEVSASIPQTDGDFVNFGVIFNWISHKQQRETIRTATPARLLGFKIVNVLCALKNHEWQKVRLRSGGLPLSSMM